MARSRLRPGALFLLPAILIASVVFSASEIQRNAALQSAQAVQQQELMLTAMLDQETGLRGYFETNDPAALTSWYQGTRDFAAALAKARQQAGDDGELQRELTKQAQLADAWHANAATAIMLLRTRHIHRIASQAIARKALLDGFRAANSTFGALLDARRDRAQTVATLVAVALSVALALALASGGMFLVRRSDRRERNRRQTERELRELLQVSESEAESRRLLVRHIARMMPGAGAAVLNRNNSDDRLEPSLDGSAQATPLRDLPTEHLQPRSCLAVRLSRPYARRRGEQTLAQCDVCGKLAADIACEPLLVGGKVIGSVLVASVGRMPDAGRALVRDAVIQAAPIIANQRNLTLAETRAASDSLTGLPNRRAADDTLKRMAAHASRSLSPLSAILVDLDHFKQVNDVHGHDVGDEALAAVGGILATTLRTSDFAARFGGEEFLVLLPDTAQEQARDVAEKLRAAIEGAVLRGGRLTASFGVASLPHDAADPEHLLRKADRALYVAKGSGRNRVEGATRFSAEDAPPAGRRAAPRDA